MSTGKKVVRVSESDNTTQSTPKSFTPTPQNKSKATSLRIISGLLWFVGIAAQIVAIAILFRTPVNMTWLIVLIAVDLAAVAIGSLLWKKSNRLDPASEKEKFRFFMQNQLGAVTAVIAFVPLIIFVLGSKNLDKKQKGVLGGIAGGALLIAALLGIDFNPPSVERYTEQTNRVEWLNDGRNDVYWTKYGTVYHVYDDCPAINTDRTEQIYEGTVAQARELKKITDLCKICERRAVKEKGLDEQDYVPSATPAL